MARKFLTPVGLPTGADLPTGAVGQLFYLTTDNRVYEHNGTSWTAVQARRDTAANWVTAQTAAGATPLLASGEVGFETDTGRFKVGNGSSLWGALPYFIPSDRVNLNATAKTAAYTLATTDYGTVVQMNGAFAFTVGTGLYNAPVGTQIMLVALTSGVTVAASGANVIVNSTPGLKLRAAYSAATLICLSSGASACTWLLTGDLSA